MVLFLFFLLVNAFATTPQPKFDIEKQNALPKRHIEFQKYAARISVGGFDGSGSVFSYNGHTILITAYHTFHGKIRTLVEIGDPMSGVHLTAGKIIYANPQSDIAVVVLDDDFQAPSLKVRKLIPTPGTWIIHHAFPNFNSRMTHTGEVSGYIWQPDDFYIMANSFAWPGTSGACVFDKKRRVIGIITSVDIGITSVGRQIIPSLVWIKPAYFIDFDALNLSLKAHEREHRLRAK